MVILNIVLALAIVGAAGFGIYKYLTNMKVTVAETENSLNVDSKPTIDDLVVIVARSIGNFLNQDFSNQNLTETEYNNKLSAKKRLRRAREEAAYGDPEYKEMIRQYIKSIITTNEIIPVSEVNINSFIPFNNPEQLLPQDKFFILLTGYQYLYETKSLSQMFKDFDFADKNIITDQMISEAFDNANDPDYCEAHGIPMNLTDFTYDQKLDYLSQTIFERYTGFGVADRLFETDIDEVDGGVSGIPEGSFQLSKDMLGAAKTSHDALWILFHGHNIHLDCVSFGSAEEIQRVCENIYKYNAQHVLSESSGYVISSMKNGSRVVVVRPPMADKFAFFVRKFDSAPSVAPQYLIRGEGSEMVRKLCEWFVRGQRNIAITGQQGTGKTTMLKSFVAWIENLNIRTQEIAFEMNLSFSYPDKNILSFQETGEVSAQEGLNVQKKTNGAVNIVGEVADAKQASHIIQTANVASLFALFTHHAKNTAALVNMIALNLLQEQLYKEKRDAVEISSQTLNVNVHLENTDTYRHIEYIDEIIPVLDQLYPSEKLLAEDAYDCEKYTEEMRRMDEREYYKRSTDRKMFEVNNIFKWNRIPGEKDASIGFYTLEHLPSTDMLLDMRNRLTDPDMKQRFDDDMVAIVAQDEQIRKQYSQYVPARQHTLPF